jgi:hypothetical protein
MVNLKLQHSVPKGKGKIKNGKSKMLNGKLKI